MGSNEFPLSERYRVAGEDWADKEAAAQLLEDMKSAIMAQRQLMLGDIPVNKAEQSVKASKEWTGYINNIIEARKVANYAKINLEVRRMEYYEQQGKDANQRSEMRMLGGTT